MQLIGIDTGGTFTDFVLFEAGRLRVHKVLSTPEAPERAILQGLRDLGVDPQDLRVVHGSTVATNAALEGKGVRTAYISNRGLGDLLTIGRQARRELYNLQPPPSTLPVPPAALSGDRRAAGVRMDRIGRTANGGGSAESCTRRLLRAGSACGGDQSALCLSG